MKKSLKTPPVHVGILISGTARGTASPSFVYSSITVSFSAVGREASHFEQYYRIKNVSGKLGQDDFCSSISINST